MAGCEAATSVRAAAAGSRSSQEDQRGVSAHTVGLAAGSEGFGAPEFLVVMVTAVFGVVIAVPGTIVFNKCKRR